MKFKIKTENLKNLDTRDVIKFALMPVKVEDENKNQYIIWLEEYSQKQRFICGFGSCEWVDVSKHVINPKKS